MLGVAKIAEFKGGGKESGDYDPSLVMSQTNVEKCKKDHPSRVMYGSESESTFYDTLGLTFTRAQGPGCNDG